MLNGFKRIVLQLFRVHVRMIENSYIIKSSLKVQTKGSKTNYLTSD